ncbi:MAG: hypothetical protein GWP91_14090 [Rhodobacterales bacterium]|nr:hypothetical protein [Rhodobacterales bacterium]
MRSLPLFLALTACGPLPNPTITTNDTGQSTTSCPQGSHWLASSASGMTLVFLMVDGASMQAIYDPLAEYETYGPAACYDSTSTDLAWVFESAGQAYGRLTVTPAGTGDQVFDGSDGSSVTLDLFGASNPVVWTGADFSIGSFTVDSAAPNVSLNLDTDGARDGHTLSVILSAEMITDTL